MLSNSVFAATVSQTEIRNFSTKLENHKAKLLRDINDSKNKLKSVTKEAKSFSDTQIFKAASCLGAIPEQDQNLDFDTITTKLKADILNEYIKLDGEIKRLGFGLEEQDPILFGNKLDTFYNQNAIKINALENEYYLKTGKVKKSFLEYLENNKELLNKLAQEMDMITNLQNIASGATAALETFKKEANLRSNFLKNLESLKAGYESKFVNDLETAFNQAIFKNHPSDDIQAKYLIHKDNFLKKFKAEMTKAQYHIFSSFFSYTDYETLVEKKKELEKRFLTVSGSIDCQQLLATNF